MTAKEHYRFYLKVRREAMRFADRRDFPPAIRSGIRSAHASSTTAGTVVCVNVRDRLDKVYTVVAIAYAAMLLGGSFSYSSDEDYTTSSGEHIMMIDISKNEAAR